MPDKKPRTSTNRTSTNRTSTKKTAPKTAAKTTAGAEPATAPGVPGGPDFEQVAETGQQSLAALAQLHSRAFRDALKFNAELLDFAQRRLTADIRTSDRLARCESVTEAMDALSDFYQGALRDYAEETTALVRLSTSVGAESAEETLAETRRPSDDKAR